MPHGSCGAWDIYARSFRGPKLGGSAWKQAFAFFALFASASPSISVAQSVIGRSIERRIRSGMR
jgi:hypothetical protein